MKHILSARQFDRDYLEQLFERTDNLIDNYNQIYSRVTFQKQLQTRTMIAFFYEASTRTRVSFCMSARHLGMAVVQTENAKEFSSAVKGEILEDSIRVLCQYDPDVIVMRHDETGAAQVAADTIDKEGSRVHFINAGDGKGEHPTQALLDLYTIRKEIGRLDDITVTIGGDLANGRTARSLAYLLSLFSGVKLVFVSPRNLSMRDDVLNHLASTGTPYLQTAGNMQDAISMADVVYWTRLQTERGSVNDSLDMTFGAKQLAVMKPVSAILHPLPRITEITRDVDNDKRAAYFRQVRNGMFIRMQLLLDMFA